MIYNFCILIRLNKEKSDIFGYIQDNVSRNFECETLCGKKLLHHFAISDFTINICILLSISYVFIFAAFYLQKIFTLNISLHHDFSVTTFLYKIGL